MSNCTVELNHANFLSKVSIIGTAIEFLTNHYDFSKVNVITGTRFSLIRSVFEDIEDNYEIDVINVLTEYYDKSSHNGTSHEKSTIDKYNARVTSSNYHNKLQQCFDFISSIYNYITDKHVKSQLWEIIKQYTTTRICTTIKDVDYDVCPCGNKMKACSETSEMVCEKCGYIIILYGTVFEDTQFYSQDGYRSKHGSYDPSRHCKFWVLRIQAKENTEIKKECLDQIMACIKRDNITDRRKLLCFQIRLYLKEINRTEYNDHIPLIRKLLTGTMPPQLTRQELIRLYNLFDKAVTAYELTKSEGKSNTMYYPYIIYKILDLVIKNSIRKRRILECIHLQSRDTLIANDNQWELICNEVPDLTYRGTDRNDQEIDI